MAVALCAFYLISLVSASETTGEQCHVYQVPIRAKALRGHTYKTAKAGELFRCHVRCERDPVCKSCNFKHTQEICEMNNETRETKPNDFITDEKSYYIKRTGGGRYIRTSCRFDDKWISSFWRKTVMLCRWESEKESLVSSNEFIKVELPQWKNSEPDVSSVIPSSERRNIARKVSKSFKWYFNLYQPVW